MSLRGTRRISSLEPEETTVAVLRGGPSGEREISLQSGKAVLDALRSIDVRCIDVEVGVDLRYSIDGGPPLDLPAALAVWLDRRVVVFPALHGPFGEDGVVQGLLEAAGLPFVGSPVGACSLAMDKLLSRRVATTLGLAVADAVETGPGSTDAELDAAIEATRAIAAPWFVKPNASGSSVGVTRVDQEGDLRGAIRTALAEPGRVVIESAVSGVEVSVPVLGDAHRDAGALPVIEIAPKGHDFFDYEAKYTPGVTDEICPARIADDDATRLSEAAVLLHDTFGCRGLSRSDFILRPDGGFVYLETNTLPGLTEVSLFPKGAAAAGMTYPELIATLVELAMRPDP